MYIYMYIYIYSMCISICISTVYVYLYVYLRLVVSTPLTPLKNIRQLGLFFPIYGKSKKPCSKPPTSGALIWPTLTVCSQKLLTEQRRSKSKETWSKSAGGLPYLKGTFRRNPKNHETIPCGLWIQVPAEERTYHWGLT